MTQVKHTNTDTRVVKPALFQVVMLKWEMLSKLVSCCTYQCFEMLEFTQFGQSATQGEGRKLDTTYTTHPQLTQLTHAAKLSHCDMTVSAPDTRNQQLGLRKIEIQ